MPLTPEEVDRVISRSVYCGNCGYNLRTLPYIYTCPECGNEYNARPLTMKGIFLPYQTSFPVGAIAATLLCTPISVILLWDGLNRAVDAQLWLGGAIGLIAIVFAVRGYRRLAHFVKARDIARRIAAEEEEEA